MQTENGTPFMDVQAYKVSFVDITTREYPKEKSGFSMAGAYYAFFDYDAIGNNPLSATSKPPA